MVLLTLIARLTDGLALCASTEDDSSAALREYKGYAKEMFRKLNSDSPARCTVNAGRDYVFHYAIEKNVCYLVLCNARFPKDNAFSYLEDISREFDARHGDAVMTQGRPYAFIAFDQYLQKRKRDFTDTGATRSNLNRVNTELHTVQRIMVQNIEDVIQRGESLNALESKASNLRDNSKYYLKSAKQLSWDVWMRKWAPVLAIGLMVLLLLVYLVFLR